MEISLHVKVSARRAADDRISLLNGVLFAPVKASVGMGAKGMVLVSPCMSRKGKIMEGVCVHRDEIQFHREFRHLLDGWMCLILHCCM